MRSDTMQETAPTPEEKAKAWKKAKAKAKEQDRTEVVGFAAEIIMQINAPREKDQKGKGAENLEIVLKAAERGNGDPKAKGKA